MCSTLGRLNSFSVRGAELGSKISVRFAAVDDLPAVIALRGRCFAQSHWSTVDERIAYMRRVFFENPWYDGSIRPLVCVDNEQIIGFIGLIRREMRLGERQISAALCSQFMVAPERRGQGIGKALIREVFAGTHDLAFSDIPEPTTERIWLSCGGSAAPMYRFFWDYSIRPFAVAAARRGMSLPVRATRKVLQPGISLLDRIVVLKHGKHHLDYVEESITTNAAVNDLYELLVPRVLRPTFTRTAANWIIDQLNEKWGAENVHAARLSDGDGECIGMFIYVVSERVAHVHMLLSKQGEEGHVLDFVLDHAAAKGLISVTGRFQPVMLNAYKNHDIPFHLIGHGLLAYSRDAEILEEILAGRALFTGLTGEWPLHF